MTRVRRFYREGGRRYLHLADVRLYPFYYIEWFFHLGGIYGGLMVLLDRVIVEQPSGPNAVFEIIGTSLGIFLLGLAAVIIGLIGIWGLARDHVRWRSCAMFGQFLLRLYVTIGTWLVYGFVTTGWVSGFTLCLIAGIIWLGLRHEHAVEEHGT